MTYQRNICLLSQENVADEGLEELVGGVEVGADDHAGDDHDDRALHDLGAARPLHLLQLGPGLADEAAALALLAAAGLRRARLHPGPDLRLAARALRAGLGRGLRRAGGLPLIAPLASGLASH